MVCKSCQSVHQGEFPAEINIHFPGEKNLSKPTVWLFPKVLICLNCGFAEFFVAPAELQKLKNFEPLKNDLPRT